MKGSMDENSNIKIISKPRSVTIPELYLDLENSL
jgi:hypothetical protein